MFSLVRSSVLKNTFVTGCKRTLASAAPAASHTVNTDNAEILEHAEKPADFSIATLRSFPSLEPHSIFPIHNQLINLPLRRDILWLSVIMELDNRRVGSSNPPGRSEHKFSRRKLFKQKGTGRARVGDANSPIRFRGAYALARTAPNDHSTDLPNKVYYLAYRTALSHVFRKGNLFIIGKDNNTDSYSEFLSNNEINENDSTNLEIKTNDSLAITRFIKSHNLNNLNLLFIANDYFKVENLRNAVLKFPSSKLQVLQKNEVEVRDLLSANRVYIEKEALDYFAAKYTKYVNF